ncbi:hypothetical protein [Pseudomarimonas salicorniae]|uniref:Anti-sigma factor n=1 Tax=Pseudomarimonas salicorniae TaxID=2933270 RepID=A0ABT0GG94_9GAMM|nr:hypothetical protein [Lysobacter sp. CAU 1642]MCK7593557.1 hypothetical protein [Lysobacter sp. CAU 1642]
MKEQTPFEATPIRDDELVLFHYRDGLDAARLAQIERALGEDVDLSRRYTLLQATLTAADLDPVPAPAAGFTDRVMAQLPATPAAPSLGHFPVGARHGAMHGRRPRRRWHLAAGGALAASLLLGVGFFAGRQTAPPVQPMTVEPMVVDAGRVYADTLGRHLGATRRVLASARFDGDSPTLAEANAALARSLLDNHGLYLAAARHNGDRRLVAVLQEIEPVLIELANPADGSGIQSRKALGEFVEREDLIFQVRAAEAGLAARGSIDI